MARGNTVALANAVSAEDPDVISMLEVQALAAPAKLPNHAIQVVSHASLQEV